MQTLKITDMFANSWQHLHPKKAYSVIACIRKIKEIHQVAPDSPIPGNLIWSIVRLMLRPKQLSNFRKLNADQIVDIYHDLFIHQPLRLFIVPEIRCKKLGITLVAPDEAMADITFGQFKYADAEFSKLAVAKEQNHAEMVEHYLYRLAASIYKPKDLPFDHLQVAVFAEAVKVTCFAWQLELMLEAYINTLAGIKSRCPTLYPVDTEQSESAKGVSMLTGPIWHEMHFNLANSKVFPGFNTARDANVYDVFDYLEKLATEKPQNS